MLWKEFFNITIHISSVTGVIQVAGRPKTRNAPPVPPPPTNRPLSSNLRSLSITEASTASASLTVALPPATEDTSTVGAPPIPPRLQRSMTTTGAIGASGSTTQTPTQPSAAATALMDNAAGDSEQNDNMANECTVCLEKPCDSVVYTCGHVCMCFECAINIKESRDPLCPICRQDIKDVIRIFKS